jgi:isoquinoline 1-oxidoreductase
MPSEPGHVVVNGVAQDVRTPPNESLLALLRDELHLTGTKYACGEAQCGACSVLVDGALTRACVTPSADAVGRSIVTIEGLAEAGRLHPVQRAFVDAAAMQCGFCTPGMVIAAAALLEATPHPSRDEIVQWMQPNLCRCGAYTRIVDAIRRAADGRVPDAGAVPSVPTSLLSGPRQPWDLVEPADRDYFDVLGDGFVVVALPPEPAPGGWASTGGAWLHVAPAGRVTAFTGKVEVGQGTRRALRIAVATELDVPLEAVELVMGDTDVCPYDAGTFGSMSMPNAARDLRRAAAAARMVLERDGTVEGGHRRLEVVGADAALGPTTGWTPRAGGDGREQVEAVTGAKVFASDVHRPGMLEGTVVRPPAFGARLEHVDVSPARAMPGVVAVADGAFIAVAAPTRAIMRAAVQTVVTEWEREQHPVREADLETHLRTHPLEAEGWDGQFADETGDVGEPAPAAVRIEASYTTPYIAHAPMETRIAVAECDADRVTVWTATQQPFAVRGALAEALDCAVEHVRVVVPDAGGGFGGKHDPDVAIAAARLSRAAGAPVRVQWSREEEFTWAYFRPAAVIDVRAGATSDGDLRTWEFENFNAGSAGIRVPYAVPNRRLRFQPSVSPLRQGAYRALASTANNFARECVIDELAHALRIDPLDFRLRNLADERLITVAQAAATRFGWGSLEAEAGFGSGIAIGIEKAGRVATCALVHVDNDHLDVVRVVTAFECGAIVDPDNLRNQIEGATMMGIGGALFEAVHFADGRIENPRFSDYRLPRFADTPPIEVELVDRPDLPPAGAGESPIIAVAPALANAVFAATGRRYRWLPLIRNGRLG